MRKNLAFLALICVSSLVVSLCPINVGATVAGSPVPSSGDWVIDNPTTVTGETIDLSCSIIVNDGGSLALDGSTLKMNCATDGQYGITVKSGGTITIRDGSHITKSGSANYYFMVNTGANFEMKDSKLEYCGYEIEDYDNNEGWKYSGPYFECDGIIENSVMNNCLQGIIAEGNTFTVKGSTIKNSIWHNIEGRNTKNFILENCEFIAGVDAIKCNVEFFAGCTGSIRNSKISGAGHNGIWCKTNNTVTIENNEIWGARDNGIWAADNCHLTIKNNVIRDNVLCGIWIEQNSKVICTGNTIKDNGKPDAPTWEKAKTGHGFAAFDSDVTFRNNVVQNNWGHNFETTRCKATFEDNTFYASREKCNVEFFEYSVITARNNVIDGAGHNCFWMRDGVRGTIEGNTIKNAPNNGIWAGNECELTIKNNVIDTCKESGIYSYDCTLTITNNEIKNCGDWGIYTKGCNVTDSGNTFTSVTKGERYMTSF